MDYYQKLINKTKHGFKKIPFPESIKDKAISNIELWMRSNFFECYLLYIIYLINMEEWDILFDSFYRSIPFGTGGRRGIIGVGPNRINLCTIKISAQGYSQYIIKKFGSNACEKGFILTSDVRNYSLEGFDSNVKALNISNNISGTDLIEAAAGVYIANGVKIYLFDSVKSTPMLSFFVRYLKAIGGCIFTASHNPPDYNGEKFYNNFGSQIIPPHDKEIELEIKKYASGLGIREIKNISLNKLIVNIPSNLDQKYYNEVKSISINACRDIKILYSPLHGTGLISVFPVLDQLGFNVQLDKKTANLSGYFENIPFNTPNPEIKQSFSELVKTASFFNSDIIINTDADADRLGLVVKHKNEWIFLNGNQIGIILSEYILSNKIKKKMKKSGFLIIKTEVTSSLIAKIAKFYGVGCIKNFLIGFKYICNHLNKLEKKGLENIFLLGVEESHGYLVGTYCRDKDASSSTVCISELASILKQKNLTLIDYINSIYSRYGYCYNDLAEIRLKGLEGRNKIDCVMNYFRENEISTIGHFKIIMKRDKWKGKIKSISSNNIKEANNIIIFTVKNLKITQFIKIIIRPSGTEQKLKIYVEVVGLPFEIKNFINARVCINNVGNDLKNAFLMLCYNIMEVNLSQRSFLLSDLLSLNDKLIYFKNEKKIKSLLLIKNRRKRQDKLFELLSFLGSNPIDKIDGAFSKKYGCSVLEYLNLSNY